MDASGVVTAAQWAMWGVFIALIAFVIGWAARARRTVPPAVQAEPALFTPSAPQHEKVRFDEDLVIRTLPDGREETLLWSDLQNVTILTSSEGPFLCNVFWVLSGAGFGCRIPSEAQGMDLLLSRLQQLPGFDNEAVISAMSSVRDEKFLCWQRSEQDETAARAGR